MPAISVIVPVYNVEEYVEECLASILDQDFEDVEVIVVDDASTDRSAQVIEDCTRGNDKVRFIRLERNVGLGFARNEGLKVATGEYLLFVDSDDWLAAGSLRAIHDRLQKTQAEVLIFDYAKAHWTGTVRRNGKRHLLQADVPDSFDLHQHPDLLTLLMVVWNKAYRRDFVERLGLQFYEGYYEDLPWTYPVLMTAQRITLLDQVGYFYRQRPSGNILRTSSRKHFDLFDQYARVFAFMDQHPELDEWRPILLQRMLQHLVFVLKQGETRIPTDQRKDFFATTAATSKALGGNVAWPKLTTEQRLLRRGAYRAFEAYQKAAQVGRPVKGLPQRVMGRARRFKPKVNRLVYAVARRLPLEPNSAVFYAYWGRGFSCNPAAVYHKLAELGPEIQGVWIVNPGARARMPKGVDYVTPQSLRYYLLLARATYFIGNVGFPSDWRKRTGQIQVMTHHGTPLKTMGKDLKNYPVAARSLNIAQHMQRVARWDFSVSSSSFTDRVWKRVYPGGYEPLKTGQPRNDLFFTATRADEAKLRRELGIADDKITILYAPTFRDWERDDEVQLDLAAFAEQIGPDYIVLARSHYYRTGAGAASPVGHAAVIDVTDHPDVQPLCLAADILLTDYSSIQFDYACLGRPIVIYAHDWDLYKKLRGVYFDLPAEPPGAVARSEDELVGIFTSREYESAAARDHLIAYRDRFCEYEDGRASERLVRRVFLGEPAQKLRPEGNPPIPALAPDPIGTVQRGRVKTAKAPSP